MPVGTSTLERSLNGLGHQGFRSYYPLCRILKIGADNQTRTTADPRRDDLRTPSSRSALTVRASWGRALPCSVHVRRWAWPGWIVDRDRITTDKASRFVGDPNDWCTSASIPSTSSISLKRSRRHDLAPVHIPIEPIPAAWHHVSELISAHTRATPKRLVRQPLPWRLHDLCADGSMWSDIFDRPVDGWSDPPHRYTRSAKGVQAPTLLRSPRTGSRA